MKVEIIKKEETKREIQYPCLMKSIYSDRIILFSKNSVGTIVYDNNKLFVGDHTNGWDMKGFGPFNGKITLEND